MADYVGERIRRVRQSRHLTISALADLAKVPQSTISEVERGSRGGANLTVDTIRRLARAMGVSIDVLAGTYDEIEEDEPAAVALVEA
jgi:transcriptional regulator with XRE-family HTH domain